MSQQFQLSNDLIRPIEKPGKTLHLLKSGSKPVPAQRVRRKVQLLGTFDQYNESKKKPPAQGQLGLGQVAAGQPPIPSSNMSFMAPQSNANSDGKNAKDAKMNKK